VRVDSLACARILSFYLAAMKQFEGRARAYAVMSHLLSRRYGLSLTDALRIIARSSAGNGGPVDGCLSDLLSGWAEQVASGQQFHRVVEPDVTELENGILAALPLDVPEALLHLASQMATLGGFSLNASEKLGP
jgi:hypothetical protein